MFFWKIDEETIRCLINKEEIGEMGFKLEELESDQFLMDEFLDAIVKHSMKYIKWNTENGVQAYAARSLPSEQFLLTISCTFQDVMIDRDVDMIRHITDLLRDNIGDDRFNEIYTATGEEKGKAFEGLIRDLQEIFTGVSPNAPKREEIPEKGIIGPDSYLITFGDFSELVDYCRLIRKMYKQRSVLYRYKDLYKLCLDFDKEFHDDLLTAVAAAPEFGGEYREQPYESDFLLEHGTLLISHDAVSILGSM